jgi:hypothetical protein
MSFMSEEAERIYKRNNPEPLVDTMYHDEKDFLAKYLFSPQINDEADYSHIDKNLAVTRLSSRHGEPEKARSILRSLHVLNNSKYFRERIIEKVIDYKEEVVDVFVCGVCKSSFRSHSSGVCCNQELKTAQATINTPITDKHIVKQSLFPRSFHNLKSSFYAFTTTSMARDGHLIRSATTTNFTQAQTMEDRTKHKGGIFALGQAGKSNY